jgi:hypothetical protein
MTPALKARILGNMSKANVTRANATQVAVPPIEAESVASSEPTQPGQSISINDPSGDEQFPLSSEFSEGNVSDGLSYTSTLPDVFDFDMDGLAPPATGPWTIIDHRTGEMIVDEEEVPPASLAVPGALSDPAIQVEVVLGVAALVQTPPPALLLADRDERPDWLIRSTNEFLKHAPYYMCLNEIVDLFFTQEAKLGYPDKVSKPCFSSCLRSLTTSFANHHSPLVSLYHL